MKIIHILNHVQQIGNGIVNVAIDLACLQAKAGHEVSVISSGGEYDLLLQNYSIKHFTRNQRAWKPFHHLEAARFYWKIFHEFQPDIVHAHLPREVVLARFLSMRFGYTLISTVHCEFQLRSVLMGLADRVIAVSNAVAESMAKRGISQKKLRVICNGTIGSPRTRQVVDYVPLPLQRPAIITVGGMYHRKGIAELIDAFTEIALIFPQVHLYLVGNGPERLLFEAQAQSTAVTDRIHFEGFQPEPQKYLLSTDIFVLASHNEPFGLVLSEAREAGCAIVASEVDGIPEALDGGKAGILVPPQNSHALAAALKQLLSNLDLLDTWKTRSQHNIEWLSVTRVHKETLDVYSELQ